MTEESSPSILGDFRSPRVTVSSYAATHVAPQAMSTMWHEARVQGPERAVAALSGQKLRHVASYLVIEANALLGTETDLKLKP